MRNRSDRRRPPEMGRIDSSEIRYTIRLVPMRTPDIARMRARHLLTGQAGTGTSPSLKERGRITRSTTPKLVQRRAPLAAQETSVLRSCYANSKLCCGGAVSADLGGSYTVTSRPLRHKESFTISLMIPQLPPACPHPMRGICTVERWARAYARATDAAHHTVHRRGRTRRRSRIIDLDKIRLQKHHRPQILVTNP